MSTNATENVEFSRRVPFDTLVEGRREMTVRADEAERAALARRFDLVDIESLDGTVLVERPHNGPVAIVSGHLAAEVVQRCVITLQPLPAAIDTTFRETFAIGRAPLPDGVAVIIDIDAEDEPEPLEGEEVDVGEVLAQQLALALDPYPRSPDAEFQREWPPGRGGKGADEGDLPSGKTNPFADLARLKPKQ